MTQPFTTGSKSLVVKDNKLINAHYSMSVLEMRLFLAMVVQVKKEDKDFKTYKVRIRDLIEATGTKSENLYHRMDLITDHLIKRYMRVPLDEGGFIKIGFVSKVEYKEKKGLVELRFDPDLKPYLLQLKEQFTIYDIRNVLSLQSSHSVRIYELLKQFERIGERTLEVEKLKEMLDLVGKYRSYNYFKKRVIIQAQEEMKEKCDIGFDFEELKEGRRVTRIRFIIHRQRKDIADTDIQNHDPELEKSLMEMGISLNQARQFIQTYSPEEIGKSINYTRKQFEMGKIRTSVGGYLKKILESGGIGESILEKEAFRKEDVQQKVEEQRKAAEELVREWEDRFDEMRRELVENMVAQASEDDWEEFGSWAREQMYLKGRVFENGKLRREGEDIEFWLRNFLSDRLPPRNEAFIQWAYKETGYQLRLLKERGEERFVIIAKQGDLFG